MKNLAPSLLITMEVLICVPKDNVDNPESYEPIRLDIKDWGGKIRIFCTGS